MPPTPDNPAVIGQHFNQVDTNNVNEKCKTYECAYCRKRYAMNVTRMKLHLQACSQCPVAVKKTLNIRRHKSSLQAALMKSDLMGSPAVYEHLIKMEAPSHELVEMEESHQYSENVSYIDRGGDRSEPMQIGNDSQHDSEGNSIVYQHYTKLAEKPNDKCATYECNFCKKKYAKNVTRMKQHLIGCSKCPIEVQRSFKIKRHLITRVEGMSRNSVDMYDSLGSYGAPEFVEVGENQESMDFSNVLNSIRKLSKRETTIIWTLMARACYASGTSFDFIENPFWIACFKKIRPNLALPTRHHLCTTLLDNEYMCMRRAVEEKLQTSASLSLQLFGWSNSKDDSLINMVIVTPTGPVLYKTLLGGGNRHSAKFLLQLIHQVFDKIGAEKFVSVMTDNVKNTQKVAQLFNSKYSSNIAFYCCSALSLGFLLQDICRIEPIRSVTNIATSIIRKLKSSLTLRNIYTVICSQIDNEKPLDLVLPIKSQRDSIVHCLETFISNETNLKSLAVHDEAGVVLELTIHNILDPEFWLSIKTIYDLLKPISDIINLLENEQNTLSVLPVLFQTIRKHLNSFIPKLAVKMKFDANEAFTAFEERKNLALHSIHYAANLLDPRTKGEALNGDEIIEGISYISSLAPILGVNKTEVISDLALYRTKQGLWSKSFVWEALETHPGEGKELPSTSWWNGICSSSPLARLASAILLSPATTASSEKSFKSYDLLQAKHSNNLSSSRAAKLVFITHNLRSLDDEVKYDSIKKTMSINEDTPMFMEEDQYLAGTDTGDESNMGVAGASIEEVEEYMTEASMQILPDNATSSRYEEEDEDSDGNVSIYVYSDIDELDDD
ncbi:uncharacterized protein LOC135849215 [Planococcus citri]|uniref:uncharacterized protein LOC135849215 n=1 Tax=Planococcus citri TaxID=170843 RepID=UPI0031F970C5